MTVTEFEIGIILICVLCALGIILAIVKQIEKDERD